MIFQITGYPRSGTAWLTTMFNLAPEVMAYHELALHDVRWKSVLAKGMENDCVTIGDIGTYQYFPKAIISQSKKVFIKRCPMDSAISAENALKQPVPHESHFIWRQNAKNWISEWNPLVIEYEDLFSITTLEDIWYYCLVDHYGDIRFPTKKVEQLLKFNIQLHEPAKALADPGAITRLAELL